AADDDHVRAYAGHVSRDALDEREALPDLDHPGTTHARVVAVRPAEQVADALPPHVDACRALAAPRVRAAARRIGEEYGAGVRVRGLPDLGLRSGVDPSEPHPVREVDLDRVRPRVEARDERAEDEAECLVQVDAALRHPLPIDPQAVGGVAADLLRDELELAHAADPESHAPRGCDRAAGEDARPDVRHVEAARPVGEAVL